MRSDFKAYLLVGTEIQPVCDLAKWGIAFEQSDNIIRRSYFPLGTISTVFLGVDHAWSGGPPLLFETMIFPVIDDEGNVSMIDEYQDRCSTYEEAMAMHYRAVSWYLWERVEQVSTAIGGRS
jgi:hypothetical protein